MPFAGDKEPYLELAGGERLTLGEIARTRPFPAARLVVLSACQSAVVGSFAAPGEEPGLPTAVMLSGAPGVIGALWPVKDLSTSLLMERFYALHLGGGPDGAAPMEPWRALGRAQRWLSALTVADLRSLMEADPALRHMARENGTRSPGARSALAAADGTDPQDPQARPFADPVYWAPFLYVGE